MLKRSKKGKLFGNFKAGFLGARLNLSSDKTSTNVFEETRKTDMVG